MTERIITVCDSIKPEELGKTLPHEHILLDLRSSCKDSGEDPSNIELFKKKVNLNNRGKVIYNAFNFIENLYNRKRLHSSLGYMPPEEFEDKFNKNKSHQLVLI